MTAVTFPTPRQAQQVMPVTDPTAFIEALLADPEFRRELEEEDRRNWETFTLRLLAWDLPGSSDFKSHKTRLLAASNLGGFLGRSEAFCGPI